MNSTARNKTSVGFGSNCPETLCVTIKVSTSEPISRLNLLQPSQAWNSPDSSFHRDVFTLKKYTQPEACGSINLRLSHKILFYLSPGSNYLISVNICVKHERNCSGFPCLFIAKLEKTTSNLCGVQGIRNISYIVRAE